MLGAAAVKDTYDLLRDGIRKILSCMDKRTKSKINLSLKAYGKGDPKRRVGGWVAPPTPHRTDHADFQQPALLRRCPFIQGVVPAVLV